MEFPRMSNASSLLELLKAEGVRARSRTPAEARAYLVQIGIVNPDGDLTPEYGGPPRDGQEDERPASEMVDQAKSRIKRDSSRESLAKAASWLERAAGMECAEALIELADWHMAGRHYPPCLGAAGRLLAQAGRLGSDKARIRHYWLIERGEKEVPNPRATYISTLSDALSGNGSARGRLARYLEMGFGVQKDLEAAALWKGQAG